MHIHQHKRPISFHVLYVSSCCTNTQGTENFTDITFGTSFLFPFSIVSSLNKCRSRSNNEPICNNIVCQNCVKAINIKILKLKCIIITSFSCCEKKHHTVLHSNAAYHLQELIDLLQKQELNSKHVVAIKETCQ
jgi:hypothetical protein